MSEMFDNYPQPSDYIPNNRPKRCEDRKLKIIVGGTSYHSFVIPFNVEDFLDYEIIYKVGLDVVLIKEKDAIQVDVKDKFTKLDCTITPFESNLFTSTILNTQAQIKLIDRLGEASYSNIFDVKVIDALDAGASYVPPVYITGFGWTED